MSPTKEPPVDVSENGDNPKTWTLDDVECSPDFTNVLTIRGMNPNNRGSGLTVSKLRMF